MHSCLPRYDPFASLVFDPAGGMRDCAKRWLRTITEPAESFAEDPARILRAVRHSARCGPCTTYFPCIPP